MGVVVVKLGVGNTASVMFALGRLGARARLSDDAAQIADAERIILPGVGAAAHAMQLLREKQLADVLKRFERPLLGICLGQQLLYDVSEEGDAKGLGRIGGVVRALSASPQTPAPHMGWSRLKRMQDHPLLEGVPEGAYAYFVHSYICPISADTVAAADYGGAFSAVIARGNVFGCQFHPERSGETGARILQNFLVTPC